MLAEHFRVHPVWVDAAAGLAEGVESAVRFTHLEGEWRLVRRGGESVLEPGRAERPDFLFRFGPGAIERLCAARGDMAEIAIVLFRLMALAEPEAGIRFRIVSSWTQLVRRGYLGLLLRAGPKLLGFAAELGVRGLRDLVRLVPRLRRGGDDALGAWMRSRGG
jgi:hypothetical protein